MAVQAGLASIRLSWTPSSDATEYIISYTGGGSSDSVTIVLSDATTDVYVLAGLVMNATYTISFVATSEVFPSDVVELPELTLGEGLLIHMYIHLRNWWAEWVHL